MVQVDAERHYRFSKYYTLDRWCSLWHQINDLQATDCRKVAEIGPGLGVMKRACAAFGISVTTIDFDTSLEPDIVADITDLPVGDNAYDGVCAFQVLEHLPFDESLVAISELARISRRYVLISLPDRWRRWRLFADIPRVGFLKLLISKPFFYRRPFTFTGEHYWEINAEGRSRRAVVKAFEEAAGLRCLRHYMLPENPYHVMMVFEK